MSICSGSDGVVVGELEASQFRKSEVELLYELEQVCSFNSLFSTQYVHVHTYKLQKLVSHLNRSHYWMPHLIAKFVFPQCSKYIP